MSIWQTVKSAAEGIGEAVISVPVTLVEGIVRTGQGLEVWDSQHEADIGAENRRFVDDMRKIYEYGLVKYNSPLEQAIRIILYHFYEALPENEKEKLIDYAIKKGFFISARTFTNDTLSKFVARRIAKKVVANAVVKRFFALSSYGVFTGLTLQGILYKASAASNRLKRYPKVYAALRAKELDMIYFLIEDSMQKYLNVIRHRNMALSIKFNF